MPASFQYSIQLCVYVIFGMSLTHPLFVVTFLNVPLFFHAGVISQLSNLAPSSTASCSPPKATRYNLRARCVKRRRKASVMLHIFPLVFFNAKDRGGVPHGAQNLINTNKKGVQEQNLLTREAEGK
jgi:hypothetical protein